MTDSHTLLSLYARTGSESAFRELVSRYLDLVYSTAYRLVGEDAQSAQDVAQTVFLALAAKAATLPQDVMLGGWLHEHTRLVAGKHRRTEHRRQLRERQAAEMNAIGDHSESNLAQVAPVLDEAIGQLDPEDRTAILLRFFERKDYRGVGEALGSSEDAARKRVDRALEKLHVLLRHRGATLSAAALGTALATEAVTAAPAGLAAAISSAAAAATTITTTLTAAKAIAMTTMQKTLITATLVASVGTGIYEAHQASTLRANIRGRDEALVRQTDRIAQLEAENERLSSPVVHAANTVPPASEPSRELLRLRGEVGVLRKQTNELGKFREDNIKLSQAVAESETNQISAEDQVIVRQTHAVDAMATLLQAIKNYATNHSGQYPANLDQLVASGDLGGTNFAGNLRLNDFQFGQGAGADPQGNQAILSLRVPIAKPGGGAVTVMGRITDAGVPQTSIWNVGQ